MSARPRIKLPDSAKVGEVIEVKTLISHVMESGMRKDSEGKTIPRLLLHTFEAKFGGKDVFKASLHTGTAANPFLSFFMKVPGPGEFELTWIEDGGARITDRQVLKIA
jgi:sulfur-oxidizing protein SoxZ